MGREVALVAAAQQRPDHPPHPLFPELVGELVEVGFAAHDEFFLRFQDGLRRHRIGAVAALVVTGARPVSKRVHEPGLPLGLPKDCRHRFGRELLPGLGSVLGKKRAHLVFGEVTEGERFGLDVEGAAAGDDLLPGARTDAVIAHVTNAAENDAMGKVGRPVRIAGPQLTQERNQRISDQ